MFREEEFSLIHIFATSISLLFSFIYNNFFKSLRRKIFIIQYIFWKIVFIFFQSSKIFYKYLE